MADTWAFGTQLQLGDGASSETFTEIARVESISGGGITQEFDDVTAHDAPDRYRQRIPTLLDQGEISFGIIWDPADPTHDNTTGLLAELTGGTLSNYRVVFPTSPTVQWTIPAFVTGFEWEAPVDGALRATITLQPSGAPTLA